MSVATPDEDDNPAGPRRWWQGWRLSRDLDVFDAAVTFIAILSVFFLVDQARQTRRAVAVAAEANAMTRQSIEQTQRAWLSAVLRVTEPLHFDPANDGNASIGVEYELKNSGQSIASNALVEIHMLGALVTPQEIGSVQDRLCQPMRTRADSRLPLGNVVFPGETIKSNTRVYLKRADILAASKHMVALAGQAWADKILPSLITCIDYTTGTSGVHRQTRYFHMVGERPDPFGMVSTDHAPGGIFKVGLWQIFYGQRAD